MMNRVAGARLSYVVVALEGEVEREYIEITKATASTQDMTREQRREAKGGLVRKKRVEPAGFLVYFPRGHVLRFRDRYELEQYGLDKEPVPINMTGLYNPNSPVGKMMMGQDAQIRAAGYKDLERMTMMLATAKSGKVLMPEQMIEAE